jgi:hypothetical protein
MARRGTATDECEEEERDVLLVGTWDGARFQERHRELTELVPSFAFALPDGTLAAVAGGSELWTLETDGFRQHAAGWQPHGYPKSLGPHEPGWLLLAGGHVERLTVSAPRAPSHEAVADLHGVLDAVRLSEAELGFVDQHGSWIYDLQARQRRGFRPHPSGDRIDALAIDAAGRLWGLGERLHWLQPEGRTATLELPFPRPLPPEHWADERRLAARGRQLFVPLREQGLLIVDADSAAAAAR